MIETIARILTPRLTWLPLVICWGAACGDSASLVTFGPNAAPGKGDDDFRQIVQIRVPAHAPQPFYLRIRDPDVGGTLDEPNGPWNTHTRFAVYAGAPDPIAAPLAEATFGEDARTDGGWQVLAALSPEQGERIGESVLFMLVVEGLDGDDGNLYDLAISAEPTTNTAVTGAELSSDRPTISIPPGAQRFTEARVEIPPGATALAVCVFDLDGARAWLERPFAPPLALRPSGDARWAEDQIRLDAAEAHGAAALVIQGGRKLLNDLALEVLDQYRRPLPLRLPIALVPRAVAPLPVITHSYPPDCLSVAFDASASDGGEQAITAYRWEFGDGTSGEGARIEHRYPRPGIYTAVLTVIDDSGRIMDRARLAYPIKVNQPPLADPGPPRIVAPGERLSFSADRSRDADGRITAQTWSFGDGQEARGARVSHAYASPGRYPVRLSVEDDGPGPCARGQATTEVWVNAAPIAEAGPEQVVAAGEPVRFDAGASRDCDGKLVDYVWDLGDGIQARGQTVEHIYKAPGSYGVILGVTDDAGVGNSHGEDRLSVRVNAPPVADAGPDQRVTASEVQFDGSRSLDPDGRIQEWTWTFGDSATGTGTGTGARPRHVYAAPGEYRVKLTVRDDSGTMSATAEDELLVRINAAPVADAGPDRLVAPGQALTFDGTGSLDPDGAVQGYAWDFGDGTGATGARVTHAYAEPGVYQARLEVRDDTADRLAVGVADAVILVNAAPVADAGPDRLVAPGASIELDASGSQDPDGRIATYRWRFSDGRPDLEGPRVRLDISEAGTLTTVLEVTDDSGAANGQAQDSVLIRINHPPTAVPPAPLQGCATRVELDGGASRDPDGDPLRYAWDFGDGSEAGDGAKVIHQFPEAGRYPVTLSVDDGSGAANARHAAATEVWIQRAPTAVAEAPALACAGDVILFNGARSEDPDGGLLLHDWDFGDGSRALTASPAKSFSQGGLYQVRLKVRDDSGLACDQGTAALAVRVVDAPVADAGADMSVCAKAPVTFDGTASRDFDGVVNSYAWDFGDGGKGGGPNPTHVYADAGDYEVTLTITGDQVGDCANRHSDGLRVRVLEAPRVGLEAPARAALGVPVAFKAVPLAPAVLDPGLRLRWDFGDGGSAEGMAVEHAYRKPGRYRVTLVVDDGRGGECSRARVEQAVLVNAPPRAVAGPDQVVATGETLVLDGSASTDPDGAISRFEWDFGDGERGEGVSARHRFARPGDYQVELTVTDDTDLPNNQQRDRLRVTSNAAPLPRIDLDPAVLCPGEAGRFDGGGSTDPDGSLTGWTWNLGDGVVKTGKTITHGYGSPGRYGLSLAVSDASQASNATSLLTREVRVNTAPRAVIAQPVRGCPGEELPFDASASLDPDGALTAYQWTFGDGAEAQGARVGHVFERAGRYGVRLRVTDDSGSACASAEAGAEAIVNGAPEARIQASALIARTGGAHDGIRFDAGGSTDPEGDPLVFHWDFGDGTSARGSLVTHAFAKPGRYSVTLSARDDSGTGCAEGQARIEIAVEGERDPP